MFVIFFITRDAYVDGPYVRPSRDGMVRLLHHDLHPWGNRRPGMLDARLMRLRRLRGRPALVASRLVDDPDVRSRHLSRSASGLARPRVRDPLGEGRQAITPNKAVMLLEQPGGAAPK